MKTLLAYHDDPKVKAKYLSRVRAHRKADELVKGIGWESNGKTRGCAVGCTLDAYNHSKYPVELGVPVEIAHLEDAIFEGLPQELAMEWPERFLKAIKPGADLSLVFPQFILWLLADDDSPQAEGVKHPLVKDAVAVVAELYRQWVKMKKRPTESAAWSAASAAKSAAESAESAARNAAESAAWSAAWSAAFKKMADKLVGLLKKS